MSLQKKHLYEFDPFRLDTVEKLLLKNGETIPLTPKVFDTLLFLVQRAGSLVEKEELLEKVWPDSFVGENNLSQNIHILRKILEEGSKKQSYIQTVPRRGYRFVAPVKEIKFEEVPEPLPQNNEIISIEEIIKEQKILPPDRAGRGKRRSTRTIFYLFLSISCLATLLSLLLYLNKVKPGPTGNNSELSAKRYTNSSVAYEAYLRGLYFWNKRTPEGLGLAVKYFEEAIAQDPKFALAYAGLADSYGLIGYLGFRPIPTEEAFKKANMAATQALVLDETLSEAHTAMALVKVHYEEDEIEAERRLKRAIELNPKFATAHSRYAHILLKQGRIDEAYIHLNKAHQLDPLSISTNTSLAYTLYLKGDYDRAIEYSIKALENEPYYFTGIYYLGFMYQQRGMYSEALEQYEKAKRLAFSPNLKGCLGHYFAVTGNREEANRLILSLKEDLQRSIEAPFNISLISAGLGDLDQAFEVLKKCDKKEFENRLTAFKFDPRFESFRRDPRFNDLIK
jgi:DNA-binding winged helix-turn-helix (wHTH) protein/Flp pilus assembly protein TadD